MSLRSWALVLESTLCEVVFVGLASVESFVEEARLYSVPFSATPPYCVAAVFNAYGEAAILGTLGGSIGLYSALSSAARSITDVLPIIASVDLTICRGTM